MCGERERGRERERERERGREKEREGGRIAATRSYEFSLLTSYLLEFIWYESLDRAKLICDSSLLHTHTGCVLAKAAKECKCVSVRVFCCLMKKKVGNCFVRHVGG